MDVEWRIDTEPDELPLDQLGSRHEARDRHLGHRQPTGHARPLEMQPRRTRDRPARRTRVPVERSGAHLACRRSHGAATSARQCATGESRSRSGRDHTKPELPPKPAIQTVPPRRSRSRIAQPPKYGLRARTRVAQEPSGRVGHEIEVDGRAPRPTVDRGASEAHTRVGRSCDCLGAPHNLPQELALADGAQGATPDACAPRADRGVHPLCRKITRGASGHARSSRHRQGDQQGCCRWSASH